MTRRKGKMTRNHPHHVGFTLAYPQAIGRAVKQYETGTADFSDCLIGELNAVFGCDATVTFDKAAAKNCGFRHPPA